MMLSTYMLLGFGHGVDQVDLFFLILIYEGHEIPSFSIFLSFLSYAFLCIMSCENLPSDIFSTLEGFHHSYLAYDHIGPCCEIIMPPAAVLRT